MIDNEREKIRGKDKRLGYNVDAYNSYDEANDYSPIIELRGLCYILIDL